MKKILPILLIVVVLVAGGGYLWWQRGEGTSETGQEESSQEESFVGTLKDALVRGGSLKCTWEVDENSFGTSYLKNEKVYAEVTSAGTSGYMILSDNCIWTWSKDSSQGFRMCFEPTGDEVMPDLEETSYGSTTPPSGVSYSCVPTVVSDAKFSPPASVTFSSIEDLMQGY